jgi:hypothetical protein
MTDQPSIYDLLAKKSLANIQTEDIHTATSRTFADLASVPFWQGVMMLSKAVETSRTFAAGLPIHTTGKVVSAALADGANVSHTPSGTEIWMLQAITEDSCSFGLKDSAGNVQQLLIDPSTSGTTALNQPIYLSSSLSLLISNASGDSKTPTFAYYKVSL